VISINFIKNGLFSNKTTSERDNLISGLSPYNDQNRLNMQDNGESVFARAFAPLVSLARNPDRVIPLEIINEIISKLTVNRFFTPVDIKKKAAPVFTEKQDETVVENCNDPFELR